MATARLTALVDWAVSQGVVLKGGLGVGVSAATGQRSMVARSHIARGEVL